MYILNAMDTATVRTAIKAAALAIGFALVFALSYYAVALVVPLIVAALTAVVVTVATVLAHAAAFAVTTLLWCAVRVVVVLAIVRALPWLWRLLVALWAHRDEVMAVARGLAFASIVVGCFLGAIIVAPLVLAVAGKIAVVAVTMAGTVASVKAM